MLNIKVFVVLGILFFPIDNIICQEYHYVPFPDSGAIWSEVYYPKLDMYGNFPPPIYERFALSGEDTIINEISYKKLYIFYDTVFNENNSICIGGIREDDHKKVYYKGDSVIHELKPSLTQLEDLGDELLLYNFSLSVGDTFKFGNLSLFDEYLIVSSVDTIWLGGGYRKEFHFDPIYWVTWIEGIGNTKGLLFTSGGLPTNGLDDDLICFKQNNNILFFNDEYEDCIPLITSIVLNSYNSGTVRLFPNPVFDDILFFDFSGTNIAYLIIYDCDGTIVNNHATGIQSTFTLSIEKYQPGIYFYEAISKYGMKHTGRFIVQ